MTTATQQEAGWAGPREPVPVPGCGVCDALDSDREIAWAVGNMSAVAVQNAELGNHPHNRPAQVAVVVTGIGFTE
ncbi:hypothetical protein ACIBEA_20005 [Streptomyces sp. NPDC051555]|uniref:hypothetical protein n=1 Tax=Streptomyces sp. NPDC051555 TaxID=3365657 RepID=UPI0037AB3216